MTINDSTKQMNIRAIKGLGDDPLILRLSELVTESRHVEWILVAHIAEVDARRLYAREGCSSMHRYCREILNLSESEAYRRIAAGRLSRRFPVLLDMLEDGRLHLAGISTLKGHLTEDNVDDVLARATHKSKRQIEVLVAELSPRPDVAATIRKLPERKANAVPSANATQLIPGSVGAVAPLVARQIATKPQFADAPQTRVERPKVEPLSPSRYKIQFTASEALRDKLERLQALAPSADLADVIEAAVTEKLERAEAKRCGKTAKPKTTLEDADTSRGARGIPAAVRREVWARDGARCTFVSSSAKRCTERHRLELHHDEPFALGGDRSTRNIRLLCRAHNALMAELDFGSETMNAFRVREPSPAFDWTPTPVRPVSPRSRQSREA